MPQRASAPHGPSSVQRDLGYIPTRTMAGTGTALSGPPSSQTLSVDTQATLDTISTEWGDVLFRGKDDWQALKYGTKGQVFTTQGASADPKYTTPTTGTVTSVDISSSTLTTSGGPITASGTLVADLKDRSVTATTYGSATKVPVFALDKYGVVTATPTDTAIAFPSSTLFTQTQTVTVANTVTETALTGTGSGTLTLPAAYFVAGTTILLNAIGYHSAVSNPTIRIRVKLGSTTVLDTGAVSSGNETNQTWQLHGFVTCRTTGVSGTVNAQGFYVEAGGGANLFSMVNTSNTTIDTTGTLAISVTIEWGTADPANSITCPILTLEGLKP